MSRKKRATYNAVLADSVQSAGALIVAPIVFLLFGVVVIKINSFFLPAVFIVLYLIFISTRITSGMCAILDLITGKTVKEEMVYCDDFETLVGVGRPSKKTEVSLTKMTEGRLLCVVFANKDGRKLYRTVFHHCMVQSCSYEVTYGKFSRIILSVLDKNNKEMLHNDE